MTEFLAALGVAVLTGMAWIAYRHPAGFRPIGAAVMVIATGALMVVIAYDIGAQSVGGALAELIARGKVGEAHRAEAAVRPNMILWLVGYMGVAVYTSFLWALPHILGLSYDNPSSRDGR